jgi:hypothetical protein
MTGKLLLTKVGRRIQNICDAEQNTIVDNNHVFSDLTAATAERVDTDPGAVLACGNA